MVAIKKGENKFFIGENEAEPKAEITFKNSGDTNLIVDHTFVSEELGGQGIAGQLVEQVISYAREEGKKIVPECSYAKRYLEKHKEHHDMVAE